MSAFVPSSNTPYTSNHTVTSTSALVLANNGTARYRSFKNVSLTDAIWLGEGAPAIVGLGICIEPRGTYEMAYSTQNIYTGEIFAISEGASTTVSIMEHRPNT